jgi:hypothetical protein
VQRDQRLPGGRRFSRPGAYTCVSELKGRAFARPNRRAAASYILLRLSASLALGQSHFQIDRQNARGLVSIDEFERVILFASSRRRRNNDIPSYQANDRRCVLGKVATVAGYTAVRFQVHGAGAIGRYDR